MSTARINAPSPVASPELQARASGAFWLLTFAMGIVAMSAGGRLVVAGNAAVTSANVLAHEGLVHLAFTANLGGTLAYVAVTLLIYELLRPVHAAVSLLAAFFSLVGCAMGAVSSFLYLAPLSVLRGDTYLSVFNTQQLQALALLLFKLSGQANNTALVFFGVHCGLIGYLILRSAFLPRAVGVLMMLAGLGWLTFLWPPLAQALFPYNMAPGMVGEGSLTLWLLVMGVNVPRWQEQAGTRREL